LRERHFDPVRGRNAPSAAHLVVMPSLQSLTELRPGNQDAHVESRVQME